MRRTGPPYKARICPFRWPGPFVFPMRLSESKRELSIPTKSNFDLKGNGGRYMSNRESLDISGEPSFWLPWWRGRLPKNRPPSIHTTVGCCCWPGGHAQKLLNGCFIIINREARKKVVWNKKGIKVPEHYFAFSPDDGKVHRLVSHPPPPPREREENRWPSLKNTRTSY